MPTDDANNPEDPKAASEPSTPPAAQIDPESIAALASAIASLKDPSPPPPVAAEEPKAMSPEEYDQKLAELLEEGDNVGAHQLMRERLLEEQARTLSATISTQAATARELASVKIDDFDRWAPQVEDYAKQRGVDPRTWTTVDAWKEAIAFVKAQNLDDILKEEREKQRQKVLEEFERAPRRAPALAGGSVKTELPEGVEVKDVGEQAIPFARDMQISIKDYAHHVKVLESFDAGDGSIDKAPLVDEDLDEYGNIIVKEGEF